MGKPMKAVFDTNILIDYLNGLEEAKRELDQFKTKQISILTFIEVLVGSKSPEEEKTLRGFLSSFDVLELTAEIAKETVAIRKELRLKVPDAIVYASARVHGCNLVTRNTKDFKDSWPDVRVPYLIQKV
jgi:predicted nucleic acid-binding protein